MTTIKSETVDKLSRRFVDDRYEKRPDKSGLLECGGSETADLNT